TLAFPDTLSYAEYGVGFASVEDWRRNNVNEFIRGLHEDLRAVNPYLPFGVSPFGVWRNQSVDPEGSDSRAGQTSYDDLYADVRLWLKNGWLDYVAPQIYFSIGYPPASFEKLLSWWEDNAYGRHVYVGQAAYKVANNHDQNWSQPSEIPRQIQLLRESDRVHGSAYFSAKWFETNPLGMSDSLVQHYYRDPVLPPAAPWIDEEPPAAPLNLDTDAIKKGLQLTWDKTEEADHAYYVVYRTQGKELPTAKPAHLHAIVWGPLESFQDRKDCRWLKKYNYLITAVDRAKNESLPSNWRSRRRWR
ncbi:MAG: family 10 glycosylhydrolase, partial [Bacteroidota bacterium]